MRTVLTPAFAKLINVGKEMVLGSDRKREMQDALKEAGKFLEEYRALYRLLGAGFYRDGEAGTLLEYVEKCMSDLDKNLRDLGNVVEKDRTFELTPVLNNVEESGGRLVSAMRELKELDKSARIESPLPVVNALIRTAYNVAKGSEKAEALSPWIPLVTTLVRKLEKDIDRFSSLHPGEKEIIKASRKLLQDLKEGVGALAGYIKDRKPVQLADALRLLKYPSTNLFILLKEMDRIAASAAAFSKIPALEEFHRSYSQWKEGKAEWEMVQGALTGLRFLAKLYDDIHNGIKAFPFFYTVENSWTAAEITRIQFQDAFDQFLKKLELRPKDLDLAPLKEHLENHSKAIEFLVTQMEAEILKVARAPHIEELKELVGRAINGNIVLEYFAQRVQFFAQSHQEILNEFGRALRRDPALGEVYDLLEQQGLGMNELLNYLDDLDKTHLYKGMTLIEKPLPRLLEIQTGVKGVMEEKVGKKRKIICIRCGNENPPSSRKCGKCSAMLPFAVAESSADAEMLGGEEGSPVNIAHIEESVQKFEGGEISSRELSMEIKSYINKLEGIRHDFDMRAKGTMGASADPEIKEWSSSFGQNLQAMTQGLETMLLFEQSPDFIYQGMQAFLAAAAELQDMRRTVKARL